MCLALAAGCTFNTQGLSREELPPDLNRVERTPLFPDGLGLVFPDAAPMQALDQGPGGAPDATAADRTPAPDLAPPPAPDQQLADKPGPSCDPSTCIGCCEGGTCRLGTEHVACGKSAAACQDCTSLGQQCLNMACAAISCSSSSTCPADKVCSGSSCVSPYGLSYRITIVGAEVDPQNPQGQSWDQYSGPDPFVVIKIGTGSWVTGTKADTLLPIWNEYLDAKLTATTVVRFEVRDADGGGSNQLIGVVELTPAVPATALHSGTFTGAGGSVKSLKLGFKLL